MANRTPKKTVDPPADAVPPLRWNGDPLPRLARESLQLATPSPISACRPHRRHRRGRLGRPCLYNERTGRLIDGHARRKVALDQGAEQVPVLVGNWSEEQEKKILATLDPMAAMAEEADKSQLEALLAEVHTDSQALKDLLSDLGKGDGVVSSAEGETREGGETLPEKFQVLVECDSEQHQRELLERFATEGLTCRSLIY